MQIMWQVVHPKLSCNVVATKPSATVITAVVPASSFLLTTMTGLKLNPKHWQESISYLSSLLDKDDRSVRIAAGEALALIFEIGSVEKFSGEVKGSIDVSTPEGSKNREGFSLVQGLKGKIINKVRDLSAEAGGKGSAKKDLNSQRNLFRHILDFFEDGYSPKNTVKIGGESLNTSSWYQMIQLNFLKRFLGGGFIRHMQENEFLQDVFGFTPKKKHLLDDEYRISSTDKGYALLISVDGLHQLHILIFFLAVFHVLYSFITMMLGRLKIRGWKNWEEETSSHDYEFSNDPSRLCHLIRPHLLEHTPVCGQGFLSSFMWDASFGNLLSLLVSLTT
ncbi:uncharacterized protein LOC142626357 [Castanea sativa]|uniref:uncharacterized protein LOC142626357 n=1 Tax=Castanea sativa TaxID=21020 RepID=UPI003F64993F